MSEVKPGTCRLCRFWDVRRDNRMTWFATGMACRRHAPIVPLVVSTRYEGGETDGQWPITREHYWCGDFEPAEVPSE